MHLSTLTSSHVASYQQVYTTSYSLVLLLPNALQSLYAADILFITTLCLTKLSVVAFFFLSTIGSSPRVVSSALGCFILVWFVISIFGLAFQCSLPHPWMFIQNTCFDRVSSQREFKSSGIANVCTRDRSGILLWFWMWLQIFASWSYHSTLSNFFNSQAPCDVRLLCHSSQE